MKRSFRLVAVPVLLCLAGTSLVLADTPERNLKQEEENRTLVQDGRIVEHWDVIQDVPEAVANTNTMF